MAMKKLIVEVFDTEEVATRAGERLKEWFGYEYTVELEGNKWKMTAKTDQNLMG